MQVALGSCGVAGTKRLQQALELHDKSTNHYKGPLDIQIIASDLFSLMYCSLCLQRNLTIPLHYC